MGISDWPEHERPRERFLSHGASVLSDAELLAIFLRTGVRGRSAVDLARDLLTTFDSDLRKLIDAPATDLAQLPGMGPAKAVQLSATFELARRALAQHASTADVFSSPETVKTWLRLKIGHLAHEAFVALWLDSGHRLIKHEELFRGTLTQTAIYPREVVKQALAHNAAAVIVAHNHPSGRTSPSQSDIEITRTLKQALGLVDVRLLDHFIVGPADGAVSLAEMGYLQ